MILLRKSIILAYSLALVLVVSADDYPRCEHTPQPFLDPKRLGYHWEPITLFFPDPSVGPSQLRQDKEVVNGQNIDFSALWGPWGDDTTQNYMEMNANPVVRGQKAINAQFRFEWGLKDGTLVSFLLGNGQGCKLYNNEIRFSYKEVKMVVVYHKVFGNGK